MNIQKLRSITKIAIPAIAESLAAVIVTSTERFAESEKTGLH